MKIECSPLTARAVSAGRRLALMCAIALTAAAAQAQITMYTDALQNGWQDYSYNGGSDFLNTNPVHSGTKSIAFAAATIPAFNGLSFARPAQPVSTNTNPLLHFWIHGGTVGGQLLFIDLALGEDVNGEIVVASAQFNPYVPGGIQANQWVEVTVDVRQPPLSYNGSFDRIDFQSASPDAVQPTLYMDDMSLEPPVAAGVSPIVIQQDMQAPALLPVSEQMLSDVITWYDGSAQPRTATVAHDNTPHFYGGTGTIFGHALREFQYRLGDGSTRVASVTTYAGNGSHGGFGYVVNHSNAGACVGDDSPLGDFFPYGTFTRVFSGRHHAIIRFTQNYPRNCPNFARTIPVTIEWMFSTGRDNPVFAITYDVDLVKRTSNNEIAPADTLFDDTRAPYGELNIDGDGFTDIDGVAWGDRFKFTSTTAPVTLSSEWTYNVANTVPYVKEWIAGPLTVDHKKNATMGLVQTQTMAQQDAGARNRYYHNITSNWNMTSAIHPNACNYGDVGPYKMPCQNEWAYQANADNLAVGVSSNNARLTWGTAYGFLGQTNYDADDEYPITNPGLSSYPPGYPKKSYSLFVILGEHTSSPVEAQVTQIETIQTLTLTASMGSVVTSGPAGVARSDAPVAYQPAGYNHVYGALAFNAMGNELAANIAVGAGTLKKPLIIIGNYTGAEPVVKLGGALLVADADYFASLRPAANELWITLNRDLTGNTNQLLINPPSDGFGLVATVVTANRVDLAWMPVPNADSYIVERASSLAAGFVTQVGAPAGSSISDTTAAANTAYLYRVRAVTGGIESANSNSALATTVIFTDPNLAAVPVKAVHMTELRTAVNAVHLLADLGAVSFTDSITMPPPPYVNIRALHMTQLRTKLDEALGPLGFATGGYTDAIVAGTTTIRAIHFQEIRDRVN